MAQPYIGEIRMFGGNFPPVGWMFCDGQELPISENEALFQLIGTTYGGDGESNFNLPNLQSRVPIHQGQGPGLSLYALSERSGVEEVTLTTTQIPVHTHAFLASAAAGGSNTPTNNVAAGSPLIDIYRETSPSANMAAQAIGPVGGSQPHTNLQPYLCITFIISLFGIFPSQT